MTNKFIRKDANKKKRIQGTGWRKPKGITNKRRLNRKGHAATVRPGFGKTVAERDSFSGLKIVTVYNVSDLEKINPKEQCVVLGKAGKQKKLDMIAKAEEKKIVVVNFNVDKFKKEAENFFAERQKVSKEKEAEKKKKIDDLKKAEKEKEAKEKASKEKEAQESDLSEEDKQKQEKQEKDKILTKK